MQIPIIIIQVLLISQISSLVDIYIYLDYSIMINVIFTKILVKQKAIGRENDTQTLNALFFMIFGSTNVICRLTTGWLRFIIFFCRLEPIIQRWPNTFQTNCIFPISVREKRGERMLKISSLNT